MPDAIYLSASVPDPNRGPEFAKTADTVAIAAAVSALVHVTLGRRLLVWGGHPAITPMVWVVAESVGVSYGDWVKLYQSNHFKDDFPEDAARFNNVVFTDDVDHDREKSLLLMRTRMFNDNRFTAAVFIGGMGGIVDEFDLLRQMQPQALALPIMSTGGAVLALQARFPGGMHSDLSDDLDYVGLFHRHLGISTKEQRFTKPANQPAVVEQRFWSPKSTPRS